MMRGQKGYTLVEVMVGMVVTTIVLGALTNVMLRVGQGFDTSNSQLTVYRQIEIAASFISGDINMAKYSDLAEGASITVSSSVGTGFDWTDYYQDANFGHRAYYYISGSDLVRDYDGVVTTVGKSLSNVTFSRGTTAAGTDRLITVTFTSSAIEGPVNFSQAKTFQFRLRPQT
ncbi:MAG: hypothetical protein HW403_1038 [Dehalococcoidia bacterium]|nr:hypothetical protein [Dehalococcoidia bacterium]